MRRPFLTPAPGRPEPIARYMTAEERAYWERVTLDMHARAAKAIAEKRAREDAERLVEEVDG